jgi:hypothetical protein
MKIAVIMTNGIANVAAVSLLLSYHFLFYLKTTEPAKQSIIVMYENVLTAVK